MSGYIAHLGRANENGARLAVEELNQRGVIVGGQKVLLELVAVDDAGNARTGMRVAQTLVDRGVFAVVGHLNSGTSIPASGIYQQAGIPQVSPSATNPKYTRNGYKTTFRVIMDDEDLGKSLGRYALNEMTAKRIAVVDDRTAYGQGIADSFIAAVQAKGASVITREFISDKATEFQDVVERLKLHSPDLIFFGGMDATAGRMVRELSVQGLQTALLGGDGICSPELAQLAGQTALNRIKVVCAEAGGVQQDRLAGMNDFYRRYKERFGEDVQVYAPYTYDAVQVLVRALEKAGTTDPQMLLPAVAQTSDYQGVTGVISFDGKGDILRGAYTLYHYPDMKRTQLVVRLGE
jgi:branched-chain amino acid transport system substrate-binding protein